MPPALRRSVFNRALRAAGGGFSLALRAVPARARYPLLRGVSRVASPLLGPARRWSSDPFLHNRLNSGPDLALFLLMRSADTRGVRVEAPVELAGDDLLQEALDEGAGVLLVGVHTYLSFYARHHLRRPGRRVVTVAAVPEPGRRGKRRRSPTTETVRVAPGFLLRVRGALRDGALVCAMLDRRRPAGSSARSIETAAGRRYVGDALIRLADRQGSRVFFARTIARPGGLRLEISGAGASAPVDGSGPATVTDAYVRYLRAHALETVGAT